MSIIRRGLHYLQPYTRLAVGALVSTLIVTATNLVAPQLFQQLIDNGLTNRNITVIIYVTVALIDIAL